MGRIMSGPCPLVRVGPCLRIWIRMRKPSPIARGLLDVPRVGSKAVDHLVDPYIMPPEPWHPWGHENPDRRSPFRGGIMKNEWRVSKRSRWLVFGIVVAVFAVACAPAPSNTAPVAPGRTIVFVHGAWVAVGSTRRYSPCSKGPGTGSIVRR